jgi:hypothetical protein
LDPAADQNPETFVRTLEQVRRTIDILIGRNYVPAYPPYLLAILQGTEAGTDIDTNASTHGYLYELFIKAAIAKVTSAVGYNVLSTYLAHIAYAMFASRKSEISVAELRNLHASLHERFEVLGDFDLQTGQLLKMQLFVRRSDTFAFRHPYIHYYFLAVYLRDHLNDPPILENVRSLAFQLYRDESASTLLFLAHLSKDRRLLEILLESAVAQFAAAPEAALEKDVEFLNRLDGSTAELVLPHEEPAEARQNYLEDLKSSDEEEERFRLERRQEIESANSALGRLNSALKTIQILGQVLKNFPANYDRTDKDNMIGACCALGGRVLGGLISSFRENETEFLEDMLRLIARRKPNMRDEKLRGRAVTAACGLYELASAGIIIRLSHAVGSSELTTTYERLFPSFKSALMRLVYISLRLEHYEQFPESLVRSEAKSLHDNPFSFRVLRFLVARHFAIFPTDFRVKQSLATVLKLDYTKVRVPRSQQKLLT